MKKHVTGFLRGKHFSNIFFLFTLLSLLGGYAISNLPVFIGAVRNASFEDTDCFNKIESQYKENIAGRNQLIDLYGGMLNLLQKDMVGNFEFIKDDKGIIQSVYQMTMSDDFADDVIALSQKLAQKNIPFVYMIEPDRAIGNPLIEQFTKRQSLHSDIRNTFEAAGIDVLDLSVAMQSGQSTSAKEDFFFRTDVHLSTAAEFWMSTLLAEHLKDEYGILFSQMEQIYDMGNYTMQYFDFLGNNARSAGRWFTGVDQFEKYIPDFQTDLTMTDFSGVQTRKGDFQSVYMNSVENAADIDLYTYWIVDYGQWPSPYYEYRNNLNPDAPRILMLIDSIFLRGTGFLTLGSSQVTVVDIRYSEGFPYVEYALDKNQYDAVVLCGSTLIGSPFITDIVLPELPQEPAQTANDWIGINGLWIDLYNGNLVDGTEEVLKISHDYIQTELVGWAADFRTLKPLSALYLQVGEHTIPCTYGIERSGLDEVYGTSDLTKVGFTVSFPTAYLHGGEIGEIYFIQVSSDGTYMYEPVPIQFELDG